MTECSSAVLDATHFYSPHRQLTTGETSWSNAPQQTAPPPESAMLALDEAVLRAVIERLIEEAHQLSIGLMYRRFRDEDLALAEMGLAEYHAGIQRDER